MVNENLSAISFNLNSSYKEKNHNNMEAYQLFLDNWKKNRPNYKYFCEDGVLVQEKWESSNSKILFLLKETHTEFTEISGPCGPTGNSPFFWRKMKIWTYIIDELVNQREPKLSAIDVIKEQPNDSIAYLNLKKNTENKEGVNSNFADIMKYVEQDKSYLIEQINLINPNIVLCCSTFRFVIKLYPNFTVISNKVICADGKIFIDFFHPSNYRKSYETEFNELKEIITSAFNKFEERFINEQSAAIYADLNLIKLFKG